MMLLPRRCCDSYEDKMPVRKPEYNKKYKKPEPKKKKM
jgi:hypothetical protein